MKLQIFGFVGQAVASCSSVVLWKAAIRAYCYRMFYIPSIYIYKFSVVKCLIVMRRTYVQDVNVRFFIGTNCVSFKTTNSVRALLSPADMY